MFKILHEKWPIFHRWRCDRIPCIPMPYTYDQSCQLECTKWWIALVARAYHSYSRTLQFSCIL